MSSKLSPLFAASLVWALSWLKCSGVGFIWFLEMVLPVKFSLKISERCPSVQQYIHYNWIWAVFSLILLWAKIKYFLVYVCRCWLLTYFLLNTYWYISSYLYISSTGFNIFSGERDASVKQSHSSADEQSTLWTLSSFTSQWRLDERTTSPLVESGTAVE